MNGAAGSSGSELRPAGWVSDAWLQLREPADGAARSSRLVEALRARLAGAPLVVHDLACGSGAMLRWLAPRLPGPQHWVLHDRDEDLLALACSRTAGLRCADGRAVSVEARTTDLAVLTAADLGGATLVTTSALLDILTEAELRGVVDAARAVAAPLLLALTVTGEVELSPAHPLDAVVSAAFNAHQRRQVDGRALLGPDAPAVARRLLSEFADVTSARTPWLLGPAEAPLLDEWLDGWVGAAREQRPDRAVELDAYLRLRQRQVRHQQLCASVGHTDLLALPRPRQAPVARAA